MYAPFFRRLTLFVLCLLLVSASAAHADVARESGTGAYILEPGTYAIGSSLDIPAGFYEVRPKGLSGTCRISASAMLTTTYDEAADALVDDLDLSALYSYSFEYTAAWWWQGVAPIVDLDCVFYLKVEGCTCYFYPTDMP